jgi:hypothetical protein
VRLFCYFPAISVAEIPKRGIILSMGGLRNPPDFAGFGVGYMRVFFPKNSLDRGGK